MFGWLAGKLDDLQRCLGVCRPEEECTSVSELLMFLEICLNFNSLIMRGLEGIISGSGG